MHSDSISAALEPSTSTSPRADEEGALELSVVVPCRDCAHVIDEQLEALAAQEVTVTWELIVVDDGSTDGTFKRLCAARERLSNLDIVMLSDGGSPGAARNAGLHAARGNVVLFCDADDVVQAGWIEALANALRHHDLVGGALAFDALNSSWPERVTGRPVHEGLALSADHLPFAHTGNLGVHRSVALDLGGFDTSMPTSEDQDFSWRAIRGGFDLGFAPGAVVQVRLPSTVRGLWRQRVSWGIGSVDLYVRHTDHMPGARTVVPLIRELWRIALLIPFTVVSRPARLHFVESLAFLAGRVRGSLKNRTVYL